VPTLGAELEGSVRPGHFAGVATVVTKLFNIAGPDRAYFGEKDFQQLTIIRRMVADLAQPVEVIGVPTVREADGLAYSSRNVYLSAEERAAAAIVPRALDEAARLIAAGVTDAKALEEGVTAFIRAEPLARPEVVAIRDPETLAEIDRTGEKPVLLLLFVRFGGTKLLDNRVIDPKNVKR
jgi:pantoate--beta-alanine ligase